MTNEEIELRMRIRKEADSWFSSLQEELKEQTQETIKIFWQRIHSRILQLYPPENPQPNQLIPLTDFECAEFQREIVPFGAFEGETVDTVMVSDKLYFDRLMFCNNGKFMKKLTRYLANPKIQDEVEEARLKFFEERKTNKFTKGDFH